MREIKFRGIYVDTGKWVYGYIFENQGRMMIFDPEDGNGTFYIVKPETVGQLLPTKDEKGKELFEGDICNALVHNIKHKGIIEFYSLSWCFDMSSYYPLCREGWLLSLNDVKNIEKIGTIHTHPELLK